MISNIESERYSRCNPKHKRASLQSTSSLHATEIHSRWHSFFGYTRDACCHALRKREMNKLQIVNAPLKVLTIYPKLTEAVATSSGSWTITPPSSGKPTSSETFPHCAGNPFANPFPKLRSQPCRTAAIGRSPTTPMPSPPS